MGLWKRLVQWLFSSSKRRRRDIHPDIRPLDVDEVAVELRLRERAKELGEARLPASDAVKLSGPEADVIQRVEKACVDYITWANTRISALNSSIRSHNVDPVVNRALQADAEFQRKASATLADAKPVLGSLSRAAEFLEQELAQFVERNKLSHKADYPTGSQAFYRYAFLAALIVVEGLLNAFFFAKGLDSGLIGGFVAACVFAVINLGVAYCTGRFLVPNIFHIRAVRRWAGYVACAGSVVWLTFMSLTIAHYRDALVVGADNPDQVALHALLSNPLSVHDVWSVLLCIVSASFGLAALIDGLVSDERYPGYGRVSRKAARAREDCDEELEEIASELSALKEDELNQLERDVEQAKVFLSSQESDIDVKCATRTRLKELIRDAGNCANALLSTFRDVNELHRQGHPRPGYFNTEVSLRSFELPDFGVEADMAALEAQREKVRQLIGRVEVLRAAIQAAFTEEFDRLKPLGRHFSSERHDDGT